MIEINENYAGHVVPRSSFLVSPDLPLKRLCVSTQMSLGTWRMHKRLLAEPYPHTVSCAGDVQGTDSPHVRDEVFLGPDIEQRCSRPRANVAHDGFLFDSSACAKTYRIGKPPLGDQENRSKQFGSPPQPSPTAPPVRSISEHGGGTTGYLSLSRTPRIDSILTQTAPTTISSSDPPYSLLLSS